MDFNSKNARMCSRIGARATYGQAINSIASKNKNVIALSADLGRSSGLDRFSKEYPNQYINPIDFYNLYMVTHPCLTNDERRKIYLNTIYTMTSNSN